MSLRTRLKRLENTVRHREPERKREEPRTEEEWLAGFEAAAQTGLFAREPDFPAALEAFRTALAQAAVSTDPPFYPPADYMRGEPERMRIYFWRRGRHFPQVDSALLQLLDIFQRTWSRVKSAADAARSEQ